MKFNAGRNIVKIVKHFCFSRNMLRHLKQHLQLRKVLDPFKKNRLINYRTYIIYLFSYVSKSFSVDAKVNILTYHYSFLKMHFNEVHLKTLFGEGIECFRECSAEDKYTVVLSSSSMLEFEGSLSLHFMANNVKIYTLSFTVAPGKIFGIAEEAVIYISCLQRDSRHVEDSIKATKYFKDITPAVILMRVLEAMATSLNIKTCLGIPARNQLSLSNEAEYLKFHSIYDEFWINNGGAFVNGNYIFSIPVPQKNILSIQQNHRSRTLKKRRRLDEIYNESYTTINLFIPAEA